MKKIVAIINHKGGTGKSTSTASIGAALAKGGYRVLLVDLDAQANLTASLLYPQPSAEASIYESIKNKKLTILPIEIKGKGSLSIVPSSLELAGIEMELASEMGREFILKELLKPEMENFDFIFIDCAPSLGLLSVNALVAATDVVVPLTAEALPYKGLKMISNFIDMVKARLNPSLTLSAIFFTRWAGRKLNKMVEESLREEYGELLLSTKVRENIALAEAPLMGRDIFSFKRDSHGAEDYLSLTNEMLLRWNIGGLTWLCDGD